MEHLLKLLSKIDNADKDSCTQEEYVMLNKVRQEIKHYEHIFSGFEVNQYKKYILRIIMILFKASDAAKKLDYLKDVEISFKDSTLEDAKPNYIDPYEYELRRMEVIERMLDIPDLNTLAKLGQAQTKNPPNFKNDVNSKDIYNDRKNGMPWKKIEEKYKMTRQALTKRIKYYEAENHISKSIIKSK